MLRVIYDYNAGYDNVWLQENDVVVDIDITDEQDGKIISVQDDRLEQELFIKYKDHVEAFCEVMGFDVNQDALDHCIINYFDRRVKEKGDFPWVEITNIRLESTLFEDEDPVVYDA